MRVSPHIVLFLSLAAWFAVCYAATNLTPYPAVPAGVDPQFDCQARRLAFEYAQRIQPWKANFKTVFDALELTTRCGVAPPVFPPENTNYYPETTAGITTAYYVDYVNGNDQNAGTIDAPFKTLNAALDAVAESPVQALFLRAGIHFLPSTLYFTTAHNGLQILPYADEEVQINGGIPLNTNWEPYTNLDGDQIWVADVSGQGIVNMTGLQFNGERAIRARYPNSNPERDFFPVGWLAQPSFKGPTTFPNPTTVTNTSYNRFKSGTNWPYYSVGVGGGCSIYTPPESFWCSSLYGGNYLTPYQLSFPVGTFPHNWTNATGAIVHAFRHNHWNSYMYEVDQWFANNRTLHWHLGGFQGSREDQFSNEAWHIENVFEELDDPNEFFYDKENELLYYYFNGTGVPPTTGFVGTNLKTLINITGSQANPVKDITFARITFQNAAITYLEPHGVPSGGDWALYRGGAIFLEGTENIQFINNTFIRLDGIGIMLSGYVQNTLIERNEFAFIGDTAMAAWGNSNGVDGTAGDFPRYNKVIGNVVREKGLYQKQSSAWFQALTAQTTLKNNIIFNGPRAGINFNDGFGGGSEIAENLIFNEVRESSDHGPFNSWDRAPYLTTVGNGTPSIDPAYNHIHHNFLLGNYGSQWNVDNDDGSCFYKIYNNLELYGRGSKSFAGGYQKYTYNNVYWCTDYCFYPHDTFVYPYNDIFYNNVAVLNSSITGFAYGYVSPGGNPPIYNELGWAWNNTIYLLNSSYAHIFFVGPINANYNWSQWQALGEDNGTSLNYGYPTYGDFFTTAWNAMWDGIEVPDRTDPCIGSLTLTQTANGGWSSNGVSYSQWTVVISTNEFPVYDLSLLFTFAPGASFNGYWEIAPIAGSPLYSVQDWHFQSGLAVPPNSEISFGYIVSSATPATISIATAQCTTAVSSCEVTASLTLISQEVVDCNLNQDYTFSLTNHGSNYSTSVQIIVQFTANAYPINFSEGFAAADSSSHIVATGQTILTYNGVIAAGNTANADFTVAVPTVNSELDGFGATPTFSVIASRCF